MREYSNVKNHLQTISIVYAPTVQQNKALSNGDFPPVKLRGDEATKYFQLKGLLITLIKEIAAENMVSKILFGECGMCFIGV